MSKNHWIKRFFGCMLNTNLPRPTHVHQSYEERYINQDASGNLLATRDFKENDPVWVKVNEHLPWKSGVIVKVHPNQSFDVQIDDKVYCRNTHNLTRRYPRVPNLNLSKDSPIKDTPQRLLRHQPKVKMPHIPVQATMQKDFIYL